MKKIFAFLFLSMTLILSACSAAPQNTPEAESSQSPAAASQASSSSCLGSADNAVVDLNCKEITIAVENAYLPFNYVSVKTGEPGGWDYETWNVICTHLHCTPIFKEAAWDGMIQSVANNQFDVAADGITITEDRAKIVDFSNGYIQIQQRLLVLKGEKRFDSLDAFVANPDLVLGTQANTTNYETAKQVLSETRIKGFEQFPFAIQALLSQDVDAVIIDEVVGMGYLGENADRLELIGPSIASDQLGFVFPKGSDLVEPVNKVLDVMKSDGSLNGINKKYFGPDFKVTENDIK